MDYCTCALVHLRTFFMSNSGSHFEWGRQALKKLALGSSPLAALADCSLLT